MSNRKNPREQYEEVKQEIDSRFPPGRYVAVENGAILADGETHAELDEALAGLGRSPQGLLIVQAGVDYPKEATIL
jgi:hypothetical protein